MTSKMTRDCMSGNIPIMYSDHAAPYRHCLIIMYRCSCSCFANSQVVSRTTASAEVLSFAAVAVTWTVAVVHVRRVLFTKVLATDGTPDSILYTTSATAAIS